MTATSRAVGRAPRSRPRRGSASRLAGADRVATAVAVCAALGLVVVCVYAQTSRFDFVGLDDYSVVVEPPQINQGITWEGLGWAFTTTQPDWQPLTLISHMLSFSLFGDDAGGHHLPNIALHALNAVLLFLALRALTGELWPCALAAALFAVHPLRAESVAWVTERKDTLSGAFWMLTMLAYAGYAKRPTIGRYALVFVALACGLMSKPMLVTLPAVLLLLDLWPLARWNAVAPGEVAQRSLGRLVLEKLPLLPLVLVAVGTTFTTLAQSGGLKSLESFPLGWRIAMPPLAYVTYLLQTVWPTGLAVIYPHPALIGTSIGSSAWQALGAALLLLAITGLCLRAWRTRPYLLVGWLWFLVTLLPVIGVVQVGSQWHADRFTYTPSIGLAIMLAWSLRDLVVARPEWRTAVGTASLGALAALAILSWRQIATWRDTITLFAHAAAATPNNFSAHAVLGGALIDVGDLEGARRELDLALAIRPTEPFAHERLGSLFEEQGDENSAARSYEEALRLNPKSSWRSRRQLFAMRLADGRIEEAAALLEGPDAAAAVTAEMRLNLGAVLLEKGRYADAVAQLQDAAVLAPSSGTIRNVLGLALAGAGRYREAEAEFVRALAIRPGDAQAEENLRLVRERMGTQ